MPARPSRGEFIALLAFLFAAVAFSIDSMLPALPQIAAALTPDDANRAQLVLSAFVFGLGLGTIAAGPLSDRFGRKPLILAGLAIYAVAAAVCVVAPTLETLLAARVVQGIGAAAPRIAGQAMVRDLFKGREMARLMSFVMMVFILIPAIAPALGALVMGVFGWHGVFGSFVVFAIIGLVWMGLRQPETLPETARRSLSAPALKAAFVETLSHHQVRLYILVLTLGFGQMFALLSSTQQIYQDIFDRGAEFPMWFALGALISGTGTLVNARLVMRIGMRRIAMAAYGGQSAISAVLVALSLAGAVPEALAFPIFFFWSVSIFFMAGVTFGNLMALALEPLGHIAGMASSVVGAASTVLSVMVAAPIGLMFNGTIVPLVMGSLVCSTLAYLLMRRTVEPASAPVGE